MDNVTASQKIAFPQCFLLLKLLTAICLLGEICWMHAESNPVSNGDFESANLTPWKAGAGGIEADQTVKHTGTLSMKLTGGGVEQTLTSGKIPVDMETEYTVSVWIRTQNVSTPDGVWVKLFQRNDSTGWNSWYPTTANDQPVERKMIKTGGTQEWIQYQYTFTPDSASDGIEIVVGMDAGVSGTAWIDDVTLSVIATRVAQRDFTGEWNNVKLYGDQMRWTDKAGAVDNMEITLPQGEYSVWLSQLGDKHLDIEVTVDGKKLGTGDGSQPSGWQKLGKTALASGLHKITLTSKDPQGFKNEAAYAGMILSTDEEVKLPDWSEQFKTPLETLPVTLYPPKPGDSKLVIVFSAHLVETRFPGAVGFPSAGGAAIAAIAHKHGIPVTWIVNNQTAVKMKDLLTKWHEEYGDDVASFDYTDWGPVKKALPWASTTSAVGGGHPNVPAMEDAGMKSAWGWCWETAGIDNITDRGCPWAPFYVSRENSKIPANYPGKVLTFEWTMRDLNKTPHIHCGDAAVYSTDPDDVRRAHLIYGRNVDYWKQFLDEYLRNTEWNEMVPFSMQQESHEMEWSFPWSIGIEDNHNAVTQDALALDEFFKYAKSKNVAFMTQPQLAAIYHERHSRTPPAYMLFRDIPTMETVYYNQPCFRKEPYPLTFLYFDTDCQMFFEAGKHLPQVIYNYQHQARQPVSVSLADERNVPPITGFSIKKTGENIVWEITVTNPNKYVVPMGLTEWGDYSHATVVSHSDNVKEVKPIGTNLLFIRCDAAPNFATTFTVEFKGQLPAIDTKTALDEKPPVSPQALKNLALGCAVTASSEERSADEVLHQAQQATDNILGTFWSSQFHDNEWLAVDLGGARKVSGVKLSWDETAYATEYVIEISDDGSNWKEIYSNASSEGGQEDIGFEPVTTRWVRVCGLRRASRFGVAIREMQIIGEPPL